MTTSSVGRAAMSRTGEFEDVVRRGTTAVGLLGIALIHFLDLPSKIKETPYLAVAYVGLMVAAVVSAELLVRRRNRWTWLVAGGVGVAPMVGYVISRTVGLPGARADVGNWLEPLGLASLFVEAAVVLLCVSALRTGRR